MTTTRARTQSTARRRRPAQRGVVAIFVGLSMAMLVGFAGLALDLTRLYVNKSELQTAADACALAAAAELTCTTGTTDCLVNATAAGQFAAQQNKSDFQNGAVAIAAADVRFSATFVPNSGYSAAGPANAGYAMCIARSAGITPWFMGVLGIGQQLVTAQAVASLQPAGAGGFCPSAPIAICPKAGGGSYAVGDWLVANANGNGNNDTGLGTPLGTYGTAVKGTFEWTSLPPPGGGSTTSLRDQLAGTTSICGVSPATSIPLDTGNHQGAKDAWNSRFGVYSNGSPNYTYTNAPPDRTGYSYPTTTMGVGVSAYADFRNRQAVGTPYQGSNGPGGTYVPQGQGNPQVQTNSVTTAAQNLQYGTDRRLIAAPVVTSCVPGTSVPVASIGCFLMLDPMPNGQNGDVFLEYRGLASSAGSGCASAGAPGGPGGTGGAVVATLVQ